MANLTIKQNDKGYTIYFTWKNADGTPKDLSAVGSAVKMKAWKQGAPATAIANLACTITNGLGGLASCVVPALTFVSPQLLEMELEHSVGTTIVDSSETYSLLVQESG